MTEQESWQDETQILRSAPGVGMVTTATLLAELSELGKMDRKKTLAPHASAGVAALVGVVPMNCDSGRERGYRKTKGGRADVRSVLYISTLVATRYKRQTQEGRSHRHAAGQATFPLCIDRLVVLHLPTE